MLTERLTGNGVAALIDGNRNVGHDVRFEFDPIETQSGIPGLPLRRDISFIGRMLRLDKGALEATGAYDLVVNDGKKYYVINSGTLCSADPLPQ